MGEWERFGVTYHFVPGNILGPPTCKGHVQDLRTSSTWSPVTHAGLRLADLSHAWFCTQRNRGHWTDGLIGLIRSPFVL